MDELIGEFLGETRESLDVIDNELVKFESDPTDRATLDNIFRLVHTIKGTCGFLGLERLEAIAHAGETLLGKFRDGDLVADSQAVTAVLQSLDRIKDILSSLEETGAEGEGDDTALIGQLEALAEGEAAQAAREPAPEPAQPAPAQVQGRQGVTGDDAPQNTVDTDGDTQRAGYEAIAQSHDDQVLARFASAKRYPGRARMRGREGVVAVEFTLSSQGAVLDARVLDGSGHRALDRAALDQVYRAEPFPPRPAELDWRSRTYRSEVRFSLRDGAR